MLEIKIERCRDAGNCLPEEDINTYFEKSSFTIYSATKLVDVENFEEPI